MKRRGTYISIAVAVAVLALLVVQLTKKQEHKDADMDSVDKVIRVTIATVVQHEFADEISAVGTLKAHSTIPLNPKVAGPVNRVLVDIGDHVKAGEVVIRLDRANFDLGVKQTQAALATAEAAVPQAEAHFEQAEKEYFRAIDLLKEKVIPQSRFDAAEAAFKTAKEAVAFANAHRDLANAALETALEHLKDTEIRSPISGTVVERNVEIGQAVAPGSELLRIVDQSSLKLDVDLPEADIGRLAVGITATIAADAFPGHEFSGIVSVVNPMVNPKTRTFCVRIEIPHPSGKLVDGMYARVKLSLEIRRALAVPRSALQRLPGSGTYYVFVLEDKSAKKRTVEIGAINDLYAEVMNGLVEDDKVITSGTGRLRSGIQVSVQDYLDKVETDKPEGTTSQEDRG